MPRKSTKSTQPTKSTKSTRKSSQPTKTTEIDIQSLSEGAVLGANLAATNPTALMGAIAGALAVGFIYCCSSSNKRKS